MDVPLIRQINRNYRVFKEDAWVDEPEPDVPNPLPVPPDTERGDILDTIDDIEGNLVSQAYKRLFGEFDVKKPHQWGEAAEYVRNRIGTVQLVPIASLTAIEPNLYGDHLSRLARGEKPRTGTKLPVIYILSSGNYIGDGNHRVVNELSKGREKVKALVIDFRQYEKDLN